MAEVQRFQLQAEDEVFDIYIESKSAPVIEPPNDEDDPGGMGFADATLVKMQQARHMIRGYTLYALSAFRDVKLAEIEEVSLKFGLKFGGKAGIPYITEGSSECNLEISVKCTPKKQEP